MGSIRPLRGKLAKGKGPTAIRLPGSSRWRFEPDDLDAYVEKSKIPAGTVTEKPRKSLVAIDITAGRPRFDQRKGPRRL